MPGADTENAQPTHYLSARARTILWTIWLSVVTIACPVVAIVAYIDAGGDWAKELPDSPASRFPDMDVTMGAAVAAFGVITVLLAGAVALNIAVLRRINRGGASRV